MNDFLKLISCICPNDILTKNAINMIFKAKIVTKNAHDMCTKNSGIMMDENAVATIHENITSFNVFGLMV